MRDWFLVMVALLSSSTAAMAGEENISIEPGIARNVGKTLEGRKIAPPPLRTRGNDLEGLYRASVYNVAVILTEGALGSSAVISVKPDHRALLITNQHVVQNSFTLKGQPSVVVLFYDAALKNESFEGQRFGDCLASSRDQSLWCQAVRQCTRIGTVVRTDESRDLALVSVAKAPQSVIGFQAGNLNRLQPGSSVAAIGHPKGLLWSFTTGIISAIRSHFLLGKGFGTLVQTQTPLNPGNSGGPLIGMDGTVAGIVFGANAGERVRFGSEELTIPPEGLNYAIGIDTVLAFTNGPTNARESPGR